MTIAFHSFCKFQRGVLPHSLLLKSLQGFFTVRAGSWLGAGWFGSLLLLLLLLLVLKGHNLAACLIQWDFLLQHF
jgi:hypothetical protein